MTVLETDICSLDLRIGVTSSVDLRNTGWRRFESVVFCTGRKERGETIVVEIEISS